MAGPVIQKMRRSSQRRPLKPLSPPQSIFLVISSFHRGKLRSRVLESEEGNPILSGTLLQISKTALVTSENAVLTACDTFLDLAEPAIYLISEQDFAMLFPSWTLLSRRLDP